MAVLAYMIPAFTAILSGVGIFAFCRAIRSFHKYMGFTMIFEGLFMLLAGYIVSAMGSFSATVFVLYYLMLLVSPFLYYFASRYFLKESGVREKDFWMLEAVILFVVLFCVVAGCLGPQDKFKFLQIISGRDVLSAGDGSGVSVLIALDNVAFLLFLAEHLFVQIFCFVNLVRYKRLLENYYSNLEGKSADSMIAIFVIVSLRFIIFVCSNFMTGTTALFVFQIIQCSVFSVFFIVTAIYVCNTRYTAEELAGMIASQPAEAEPRQSHQISSAVYEAISSRLDRLIDERFFLDPNVDLFALSTKVQVNSKYVADFLKAKYGETFLYFVNRLRIEYAISLMEEKNVNLQDVAEQSGFISQSTFYRNFIKVKGVSPAGFRKKPV